MYLTCMEQANKLTAGDYEGIKSVQRLHTQLNTHENAHETWFIRFSKRASANVLLNTLMGRSSILVLFGLGQVLVGFVV